MDERAVRWSGLPLIAGAGLLGASIVWVSLSPVAGATHSPVVGSLLLMASILLLLSLPGLYARQANAADWLGLAGHVLLQTGMLLVVVGASTPLRYPSFNRPASEGDAVDFLLGVALTLGLLLTGIATLRAGVFPRWTGILLLAATAGFFLVFFVAEFLPPQAGQLGAAFFGALLALSLASVGWSLTRRLHDA